jgi:hypothetical protein
MAIKVFYHICALTRVAEIVQEAVTALHFSGLYDEAEAIYCFISGDEDLAAKVEALLRRSGKKFMIAKMEPGDNTFERLTLENIHRYVEATDRILYIHSKGVSPQHQIKAQKRQCIDDWRYLMLYYLVGKYKECLSHLEKVDTVGVNYTFNGNTRRAFSGNFWWVRGSYFITLPKQIGPDYYDVELKFLFLNNPTYHCLHQTRNNHYRSEYPPECYVSDSSTHHSEKNSSQREET